MNAEAMYFSFELVGLLVFVLLFAYAFGMALVVRNVKYIVVYPLAFITECILWFLIPALPIFYFTVSKGIKQSTAFRWYIAMGSAIVALHVLFHISGFYDYLFANETVPM
jgi:hypothetical protein